MDNRKKNVLDQILETYEQLYEAERKVANYIVDNEKKVIDMTTSELSLESGVSEATIIRMCKKCNFKGFHHLKIQLAKEMVISEEKNISNDINSNNIEQSLKNILANKIQELKQTILMMDEDYIKRILYIIKKARIVEFSALGNSIPVILDASYKFNQIGIPSVASTIWENQLAYAYTLGAEDVLIVVSDSGSSKKLLTLLDIASKKQVDTICITSHKKSPLANKSKYILNTVTRERLFFDEFSFTSLPAMVVIEVLFLLLADEKNDSYKWISQHEQSMADDKF
ncbi:SIS domain-containing protein [Clostridium tyrobutyricum]|uniref:Sialic acid utilization regulator, RpiR family n=1 Tax=Clostridium tyrobutyricum DIVETGP TaxID=1408889 RepID=W6N2E5_CLOTY|nr:MurR/RpiR family transcriptional regulator [Clostridium tyrobutyricum]AND84000.1 RpiR family transcriptional regulator [Clostridium tyrobutyricum]ANP68738.1 RpiR family transcriptional regulator [Clostridium tyrobutyricum]MBR9647156.1 MurR/RpiR family transcriptional regulator [Clostridium tyrobutyricum]MBV4422277.1 MurR/RpiR family transcriptional regulator [Clostridium tyrobutyricum]MBV4427035.1 MurR/RpiR family transcriptional regulator [Clostridium tyrobutyricum]